jgi:hypothetical protein
MAESATRVSEVLAQIAMPQEKNNFLNLATWALVNVEDIQTDERRQPSIDSIPTG